MNIRDYGWSVGSLSAADPNGQSFKSPDQRHSGARKQSHQQGAESDYLTLDSQAIHRDPNNPATAKLGSAISLSQTQDGFLQKVQQALHRMSELSSLAQGSSKVEGGPARYATEFTELQNQLKDIGSKMSQAVDLFQPSGVVMALDSDDLALETAVDSVVPNDSIEDYLASTANPSVTAINNAANAAQAVSAIDRALVAVSDLRVKVGSNLQRLNLTREQLSARTEILAGANERIQDMNVAEKSTLFARYDMLTRSGTAMLAQANAFAGSALQLLD
jgi:flagellin